MNFGHQLSKFLSFKHHLVVSYIVWQTSFEASELILDTGLIEQILDEFD